MIIGISGYSGAGKDTVGRIIQYLNCFNVGSVPVQEAIHAEHDWWMEEQSGWEIKKFAGKLKQIASLLTGIPIEKFEDQQFKKTLLGPEWDYWEVSLAKHTAKKKKPFVKEGRFSSGQDALIYKSVASTQYGYGHNHQWRTEKHQMSVRQFLQELGTEGLRTGLHNNVWLNALYADYTADSNWIITDCRFPNEAQSIKDRNGIIIRVERPGLTQINNHPSEHSLDNWSFDYKIMNDSDLDNLKNIVRNILEKENLLQHA